jgi:hypothetical protein
MLQVGGGLLVALAGRQPDRQRAGTCVALCAGRRSAERGETVGNAGAAHLYLPATRMTV